MRWRWAAWTAGMAMLGLLAFLPLRVALGMSDLRRIGFTARQVAGTVWYGRIGELNLRKQSVGTFEVSLAPLPLLIGDINMRFKRLDGPEGPLEGRLVAGISRGIVNTSGRFPVGDMFAPLPIAALELDKVTLVFRSGRCRAASGQVHPIFAAPVPGVTFDADMSAPIECEGERARVHWRAPSGQDLEFYVQQSGRYRAWVSVRSSDAVAGAALAAIGFKPSEEGMRLTIDGQL